MKAFKILTIALLLILSVGMVSAIDISDFHSPKGFDEGFGEIMEFEDYGITIDDYDAELDYNNVFKNDEFHNITIKDNIAQYTDSFHDEVGVMELVKIGKSSYVVKCKYSGTDDTKINDCLKYLKEFNKKNKLEPEKIKKPSDSI